MPSSWKLCILEWECCRCLLFSETSQILWSCFESLAGVLFWVLGTEWCWLVRWVYLKIISKRFGSFGNDSGCFLCLTDRKGARLRSFTRARSNPWSELVCEQKTSPKTSWRIWSKNLHSYSVPWWCYYSTSRSTSSGNVPWFKGTQA